MPESIPDSPTRDITKLLHLTIGANGHPLEPIPLMDLEAEYQYHG